MAISLMAKGEITSHYLREAFNSTSHHSSYILIPQSTVEENSVGIVELTEQGKEMYNFPICAIPFTAFLNETDETIKQNLQKDTSQAPLETRNKTSVAMAG